MREWNYYIRVVLNEAAVKIAEAQEWLNVFNVAGFWLVHDSADFVGWHC